MLGVTGPRVLLSWSIAALFPKPSSKANCSGMNGEHSREPTGAKRANSRLPKSGTVFLDEVSTISHAAQIKLLQVLQEHTFYRVGGETPIETDVRIIAATNEELADLIKQGKFRQDLYYRLNVFPIALPPLSHRLEDIPMLAEGFLRRLNEVYGKAIRGIDPRVIEAFNQYSWPGNVRELENVLERALHTRKYQHSHSREFSHRAPGVSFACLLGQ